MRCKICEDPDFKRPGGSVDLPVRIFLAIAIILCSSCSAFEDPYVVSGATGGLVGAGVGAGTGAIVGSVIANGDVAGSALLGGAIGIPVGIVAGVAYRSYTEKSELEKNNDIIRANYDYIVARQYEIDALREDLIDDSHRIRPNQQLRDEVYTGATIGEYNR